MRARLGPAPASGLGGGALEVVAALAKRPVAAVQAYLNSTLDVDGLFLECADCSVALLPLPAWRVRIAEHSGYRIPISPSFRRLLPYMMGFLHMWSFEILSLDYPVCD